MVRKSFYKQVWSIWVLKTKWKKCIQNKKKSCTCTDLYYVYTPVMYLAAHPQIATMPTEVGPCTKVLYQGWYCIKFHLWYGSVLQQSSCVFCTTYQTLTNFHNSNQCCHFCKYIHTHGWLQDTGALPTRLSTRLPMRVIVFSPRRVRTEADSSCHGLYMDQCHLVLLGCGAEFFLPVPFLVHFVHFVSDFPNI